MGWGEEASCWGGEVSCWEEMSGEEVVGGKEASGEDVVSWEEVSVDVVDWFDWGALLFGHLPCSLMVPHRQALASGLG